MGDDIPMNAANERDLRLLFNGTGPITRIKIMKPRNRNMKVRAYMEFVDEKSVQNALKLHGTVWMNDTISVRRSGNEHRQNRGYYARDSGYDRQRESAYDRRDARYGIGFENDDYHKSDYSKRTKSKSVDIGGCIQKENGKIIIERKYQLTEVCTTFNGVTGCFSSDCDKIHVCSLCECEDHSLPKCPRTNTKIGEILMKQLQKENHKKGAAMTRIELNQKVKKRTFSAMDKESKDSQKYVKREKKRIKMSDDHMHRSEEDKPLQIAHFDDIRENYLLFLLDGSVWRRAIVLSNDGEFIRCHYMGWDAKYDEKLSLQRDCKRISIYKPSSFHSEATITKEIVSKLKNIESTTDMNNLHVDKVKHYLKLCQLKHDGDIGLLRERLLNVIDEIKIKEIDEHNRGDIIGVNMRRINELYCPTSDKRRDDRKRSNSTKSIKEEESELKNVAAADNQKYNKQKLQQLCPDYNTAKGCLSKDCQFMHECDLCGSALHINLDCPNHNL